MKICAVSLTIFIWINISACLNYYVTRTDSSDIPIDTECRNLNASTVSNNFTPGIDPNSTDLIERSTNILSGRRTYNKKSWVVMKGMDHDDVPISSLLTWSYFMALSQMFCIGYGQLPPQTYSEMMMVMFSTCVGAIIWSIILGTITSSLENFHSDKKQLANKIEEVKEYMHFKKIPTDLREAIVGYYETKFDGKVFNESKILMELNPILRTQIIDFNCFDLVRRCKLFTYSSSCFIHAIIQKLSYEIYQENDQIIKCGQQGRRMYFISSGSVLILSETFKLQQFMRTGQYGSGSKIKKKYGQNLFFFQKKTCHKTLLSFRRNVLAKPFW